MWEVAIILAPVLPGGLPGLATHPPLLHLRHTSLAHRAYPTLWNSAPRPHSAPKVSSCSQDAGCDVSCPHSAPKECPQVITRCGVRRTQGNQLMPTRIHTVLTRGECPGGRSPPPPTYLAPGGWVPGWTLASSVHPPRRSACTSLLAPSPWRHASPLLQRHHSKSAGSPVYSITQLFEVPVLL